jgi:outer membrane lipoprotein SlyB
MGLSPINSQLANMEFMLYGGASGLNSNVPSVYNGYRANAYNCNPSFMGGYGYGYNPAMNGYYNPSVFTNPQTAAATAAGLGAAAGAAATAAQGISEQDLNVLADYATKINEGGETFGGALMGGVTFAAFENMQNVKHPFNAIQGMKKASGVFDLKNPQIKALWESNPELMQRAYSQTQAAYRRMGSKWAGIQNWFAKPFSDTKIIAGTNLTEKQYVESIIKKLQTEIVKGANADKEVVAKLTEQLKAARGMDGYIPSAWNWVKNHTWNKIVSGSAKAKNYDASERIARKANQINEGTKVLSVGAKFAKEFKGWFIFESLIEGVTKVLPTYMEGGADSGNKQLLQSGAKAAASAAGWSAGRLAGGVLGAKAGAAIGTMFGPGIGTAVGSVVGFACGCVGSWLANKGLKAIMGKDESEKLAEAKMKKTQEGQAQLVQLAYQKAMTGEAPKEVVNSLQNVMKQIA